MKPVFNKSLAKAISSEFNRRKLLWSVVGVTTYTLAVASTAAFLRGDGTLRTLINITQSHISVPVNYLGSFFVNKDPLILDINQKNLIKIDKKRQESVKQGILITKNDDWHNFKARRSKVNYTGKLRLKGNFFDHWNDSGDWSYKLKLDNDKTILGLKNFAIQHPRTRGYMNDWYFQKMLGYTGLISTRYEYIPLIINGKRYPIYQIEENKDKRLIENNNRREGPIFKLFTREEPQKRDVQVVSFYQEKKWKSTPKGNLILRKAEDLILGFQSGQYRLNQVFDIELFASAVALSDLFGYHHALGSHNLRFYYNPITGLIEPIPFDLYRIKDLKVKGLLGEQYIHQFINENKLDRDSYLSPNWTPDSAISIIQPFFNSEEFSRKYIKALEKYSQKKWLDKFFVSISEDEEKVLKLLHKSYPWYKFEHKETLYKNQIYIQQKLEPKYGLRAFVAEIDNKNNKHLLRVQNNHSLPIEIIGIQNSENKLTNFSKPFILNNKPKSCFGEDCYYYIRTRQPFKYMDLDLILDSNEINLEDPYRLVSRVLGTKNNFTDILKSKSEVKYEEQSIKEISELEFINYNKETKTITVKNGSWTFLNDLIIPAGYSLIINKDTSINLINDAAIISYSPIYLYGTSEKPVNISSSDKSGQGILIINSRKKSIINNTIFKNLSMAKRAGLNITGSITFYESDVAISNSIFKENMSEDSLNIVRSKFEINNTIFNNSYSDALDLDFSNGSISNSKFLNIGNDGIDLSGSRVDILNINMNIIGDKGISIGEKSNSYISNINIANSNVGIACKDSSTLNGKKINITSSQIALATYQKKPEFGSCTAVLNQLKYEKNIKPYLIELKSDVKVNGNSIKENSTNTFDYLSQTSY